MTMNILTTPGVVGRMFTRVLRKSQRQLARLRFAATGRATRAVFAVGSGRSGTDLVVHCLGQSLNVAVLNEDNPAVFDNWRLRDLTIVRHQIARAGADIALLKPIVETQRVRELLDAFPGSRALFIVRHFHDTINSRVKFFGDSQQGMVDTWLATDFERFPALPASVRETVRAAWVVDQSTTTAAAIAWLVINTSYVYLELHADPRVQLMQYESLVGESVPCLRRACAFIGIDYNDRMTRGIYETSVRRSQPPVLPPELEAACAAQWVTFSAPDHR
jgi:hypothetical protein